MAHDVAVVGGGHNGLICAAYLARAGLDVAVFEARDTVGGCASTVDALGVRVNTCNCDHIAIRSTPVADELELARYGLRYLDVDPAQLSLIWEGGRGWFLFHDVERTFEALRLAYPAEVDAYRRYVKDALPVVRLLLRAALTVPTRRRVAGLAARHPGTAARLARWSRASALGVLRDYFSEEALVAPACVVGPAVWGVSPALPGTGLGALGYALRHAVRTGRPVGGSGALPAAIAASLAAAGGTLRTGTRVSAILADDRVRGIVLDGREEVDAGVVVVACDPRRAVVDWLRDPPRVARSLAVRWRAVLAGDGYQTKLDAVVSAPPRYRGVGADAERLGVADECIPTAVLTPPGGALDTAWREMGSGRVADRPPAMVNVPSVLDEEMRAGAEHVFSVEALYTPYALEGGWEGTDAPDRWLAALAEVVQPGFPDSVLRRRAVTPVDWERDFSMERGFSPAYGRSPVALLTGREPELTRYETPLPGLFLTGQATYPGASVWGASGRNAARVVARRRGIELAG